jgi:hypothetical protein
MPVRCGRVASAQGAHAHAMCTTRAMRVKTNTVAVENVDRVFPRVAVLYSGIFLGSRGSINWAANHLKTLIKPNDAAVFVAISPTTWCDAPPSALVAHRAGDWATAETILRVQVRTVFQGWSRLYVSLCTAADSNLPHQYGRAGIEAMRRVGMRHTRAAFFVHRWYLQFEHYARVEGLRRVHGPHELVVYVQMNIEIKQLVHFSLPFANDTIVVNTRASDGASVVLTQLSSAKRSHDVGAVGSMQRLPGANVTKWVWNDWIFMGTPAALAPLSEMTSRGVIYTQNTTRCIGLCSDDQTTLQLQQFGTRLFPLALSMELHKLTRPPCNIVPLINLSELSGKYRISAWYAPCPRYKPCTLEVPASINAAGARVNRWG